MKTLFVVFVTLLIFWCNSRIYSQNFWEQSNGPYGGEVRALVVNQDGVIFAGVVDLGLFKSEDNGENWINLTNGLGHKSVYSIAINSDGRMFAGTRYDGVFYSTNNGNDWIQSGLTFNHIKR